MGNDDEWVQNVKRWCLEQAIGGTAAREPDASEVPGSEDAAEDPLGYETAHPALQARHWPDAAA
jgi:hypothetical protein